MFADTLSSKATVAPDGRIGFRDLKDLQRSVGSGYPTRMSLKKYNEGTDAEFGLYLVEVTDIRIVEQCVSLAERVAREKSVPREWILAVIYAESRGDEKAESSDGGWGLMQITNAAFKKGRTKEQVFDPYTNVSLGSGIISAYMRRNPEANLYEAASIFNAGGSPAFRPHPSDKSPWGIRETTGHISRVVAANNALVRYFEEAACRA